MSISPTETRIRIKMGPIEVEFEGTEEFLKDELKVLLGEVASLYKNAGIGAIAHSENGSSNGNGLAQPGSITGSTNTIAAKLDVNSGPDLIMAAAAHLTFVAGTPVFKRAQLTAAMRDATTYHKKTYVNNLTKYLDGLLKDQKLIEPTTGSYALGAGTRTDLAKKLA